MQNNPSMLKTESVTSLGMPNRNKNRPIANALFIQNVNPLKKK